MTGARRIAFIGTVGVPNRYGGFEAFVDACAPRVAALGHRVLVTCDARRYEDRSGSWRGVRRVFVPVPANGPLSVVHDLLAFLAVCWRADAVVVLGVSGGVWFPGMRLLSSLLGVRLVVNVDGIEWRRKSSWVRNAFLRVSDRCAQLFAHAVIYDNAALLPYVVQSRRGSARLIAYPGDHVARRGSGPAPGAEASCLTICRIEPENHCDTLLEAARRAGARYVFVGNWGASRYGVELRERYGSVTGFRLLDPVYDAEEVAKLREECTVYLHGHGVGGTNPSLVEMLFYDCAIAAFDCRFNRVTAGDAASYFSTVDELAALIRRPPPVPDGARARARAAYSGERIAAQYVAVAVGLPDPAPYAPLPPNTRSLSAQRSPHE
jgi:glycosyltransferase involved in cell wall biosynthesis